METEGTLPAALGLRLRRLGPSAPRLGHEERLLLEVALDRVGQSLGEALLKSRDAGDLPNEPRDRPDAANPVGGDVAYGDRAEIGHEVMRAHAVDGNALETDRLTRAPTVARGSQRSRLSAERRGGLGEKIGGELRGDRVLGIAPGIDA